MCTMTPPSRNGGARPCGLHLAFLLPPTPAIVLKGLVVNASLSECKTGTPLSQVGSPWPGPMDASIQGLSSMSPGQLSVTPLWPRELGKNQPIAGPGRGFEDLGRKGFCSPPPPKTGRSCPAGPYRLSLHSLQEHKHFLGLPRPDGGLAGACGGPPKARLPRLTSF